jgi:hypothetical protein
MKRNTLIIVVLLASFTMLFGCGVGGYKLVKETDTPVAVEPPEPPAPHDALVGMLTNQTSHQGPLYKTLYGILNGGEVVDRWTEGENLWIVVNGQHVPHEKVDEYWIVRDKGGNFHKIWLKNGVLFKIQRGEDPSATAGVKPYMGWSK